MLFASVAMHADTFTWTDWKTATLSNSSVAGSAAGTLTIGLQTVNVTYSGDLTTATEVNCGGCINYYTPASVYTNATVSNLPTTADILALSEDPAYTDTITFSTAILNPVFDIVNS